MIKDDKKLIALQLPKETYEELQLISEERFLSLSAVIRLIIVDYLKNRKEKDK